MSRIGRKPVEVPSGVSVQIDNRSVAIEGVMGRLQWGFPVGIEVGFDESSRLIEVKRQGDAKQARAFHGLTRSLIQNMVTGVAKGFEKRLEIVGVGYQAQLRGDSLEVSVGFAKPVLVAIPSGLSVEAPDPTHVVVRGADKQAVGQFAAVVRKIRPPEPYKGKGIRYQGEQIRRKAGKAFASGS